METFNKKGGISVERDHIFPVIKKWLYSEKDIFLREIVSNACDAVTKLRRLNALGQYDGGEEKYRVTVALDKDAKTLTVSDNGIGMTAEELEKYICQIALSGAVDFIQKYEGDNAGSGIIGHFGLGFYSAFMVSDRVDVLTKSYTGAPAVFWTCTEDGQYEMSDGERTEHGTTVVMHVSDEESAYLEKYKLTEILDKYCAFMPVEIFFEDGEKQEVKEGDTPKEPTPVNDTTPLWLKNPSDCTEEEYKDFYRKVFHDYKEPLFWIHVNADYPLNFKGILYFPRFNNAYESIEGQVKLYYNQVFVADNIKEVIPEYLLMLKGVLDCPELPLNVSRSYLQNNAYVSKVSAHIVKKVADKLNGLCTTEREKYESVWKDVATFVEYACMRDRKFYDRVKDVLLYTLTDGKTVTSGEYVETAKSKHENVVYYTTDVAGQAQYVKLFEDAGIQVAVFDKPLDVQFASTMEGYNDTVKYKRIDAGVDEVLKGDGVTDGDDALVELFKKVSGNDKLTVGFTALTDTTVPMMLTVSEENRRMEEMMKMYGMADTTGLPTEMTLTVNNACPLIEKLKNTADADKQERFAGYLYQLALLSQRKLTADELKKFLTDSYGLLGELN